MPVTADDLTARVGFSTASLPDHSLDEALRAGAAMGFTCVELLAFEGYRHTAGELAGRFFDRLDPRQVENLAQKVADFERVAVHAPFWEIVPFAANPTTAEASRAQLRRTVEVCGEIGAETVTTHVIPRAGRPLEHFRRDVLDFYRQLGDVAAKRGVTITIETCYPPRIEHFAALVHEIDHPAVGANVDVGHLRMLLTEQQRRPQALTEAYNALLDAHLRSLAGKLYHMHLHDTQLEGVRDHRECGTGIIDYEAIFRMLLDVDYAGFMTFELEEPDARAALARSRDAIAGAIRAAAGG